MILFIGQVAREQVEREAFQEVDFRRMFGPMAKWVAQIDDAARIPELVSQAFHRAVSGRPGPVLLALPEDMLTDRVEVADAVPYRVVRAAPSPQDMARLRDMLAAAERPLVILGGGGWTKEACDDIRVFIEAQAGLPFSYREVGATRGDPPAGYAVDHNRVCLGNRRAVFERAGAAILGEKGISQPWHRRSLRRHGRRRAFARFESETDASCLWHRRQSLRGNHGVRSNRGRDQTGACGNRRSRRNSGSHAGAAGTYRPAYDH